MSKYSNEEQVQWQARINKRIEQLDSLQSSALESTDIVTLDQAKVGRLSRMDALQGQAMAKAHAARRRQEISLLRAALRKLDEGCFGECEICFEAIGSRRLENNPAVALCLSCAEKAENI